ncbi:hypothetical protein M501DRAFT_971739 [Patellaria atrata CBS 101060]|uniref:Uncharacterized protein n=1 Tax=Patellaria atrata CBS 101060 TaxID=1346257 RepID=A0A9P4VUX8_9PEZI|nr:hypothetical protein M501DRAFT_971739 [Patellaria atrata CBS 101060]
MGNVLDPNFWRRFSAAVHQDEEAQKARTRGGNSWLERQKRKKSRRTYICWTFWLCFAILVAGLVAVIIWLKNKGVFNKDLFDKGE